MNEFKANDYIRPEEKINVFIYDSYGTTPEHIHDFVEFVYIISGSGTHVVNGIDYNISRGDLFCVNFDQSHTFSSEKGMRLVNILLKPEFFSEELIHSENALEILGLSLFEEFNGKIDRLIPYISFRGKDLLETEALIEAMVKEFANKDIGYRAALKGYMEVFLTMVLRRMKITPAEGIISHIHRISPEIIRYIEENCFENITIKELAQKCFYNPSYFSTVFKAIYGKTLTEFIHEKRIQEAVRLLMETDDNIDRISLSVGYQDRKQFYKLFKDQTGITPGEMRKRTQKTTTNI